MIRVLLLCLLTIMLIIIFKVFLFATFKIPTPSMTPAIIPGDYIFVNKLILGPRIYQNSNFLKGEKITFSRLKGMRSVLRNDIVVFNCPYPTPDKMEPDLNIYFVKRCLGMPGDSFLIEDGYYKIYGYPEPLGLPHLQEELSQIPDHELHEDFFYCFPFDTVHNWNIKNWGPIYIPAKGDTLIINNKNINFYKMIINYETGKEITLKENKVFLGNKPCKSYTFKQNYYFMAGDWIFDSYDSRYWGLLPEDFIVGKAAIIWKSKDPYSGKYRWNRFLKQVK